MYKLIAFDAYGTLFDVYSMGQLAEELFPGHGPETSLLLGMNHGGVFP